MQVVKEKSPRFFSNLNFAKIFYLPPISCRGEVGGILFKHRQVRFKKKHILPPQAATSSVFICFADYAVTSKCIGAAAEWNDFTSGMKWLAAA